MELYNWNRIRMYDLSQPISHLTPAWPTYEPLQIKFFKRLVPNGANGQVLTHSNHVGTHLDGSLHFCTHGRDIAAIPLEELVGPGVIVDLSDIAEDYGIYTSKDIEERVEVKEGDILVINTGYHRYAFDQPEADEVRYMVKHPGPTMEFAQWCEKKRIKWIGVDCGSADHPMNTKIREWMPGRAAECETFFQKKFGRTIDDLFPPDHYQLMHVRLFPQNIIHAENLGGEIDLLLNKRTTIGCFPWRFEGGESCICRIVAFDEN
ncbi:MAG TPA: cyclase family protein [Thermotogota bacterium]|nr:cyclase family protein [Thermotogota bacterium]HNT94896.1 cyclase family protein [Thermotogota bacterium]HOZ12542.1 cyclase family protein [Thermotogota bacterium]HPH10813.1 cyclase family protein [Thermotogota bacterium]HPX97298.1 cyclase family protein [Thermotogota bacterium]